MIKWRIFWVWGTAMLSAGLAAAAFARSAVEAGLSQPVGASKGVWAPGYAVGAEMELASPAPSLRWSAAVEFQRWKPDAEKLLETSGRELKVEENRGWNLLADVAAVGRADLGTWRGVGGKVELAARAGVGYLRRSEVTVRGYLPAGESSLNRYVFKNARTAWVPVLGAEAALRWSSAAPRLRVVKTLGEEGMTAVTVALAFLR